MRALITRCITLSVFTIAAGAAQLQAKAPEVLWSVANFKMPESVVYDVVQQRFYVSNVNGSPMAQDGNGSIGWIAASGQAAEPEWVKGLHSPKGILLDYPYLYIADVQELVVVNVKSGLIAARYEAKHSAVLNGIAKTDDGQIYVSDWAGNAIYRLTQNELVKWLESPALQSPNGLVAQGNHLYLGSWGDDIQSDFSTKTSGSLKRITLADKAIETLTDSGQWMNLDGLHRLENGVVLATDFMAGELLVIRSSGRIETRYPLEVSAADFYFDPQQKLLVVPYLMGNKVTAYRLDRY